MRKYERSEAIAETLMSCAIVAGFAVFAVLTIVYTAL